MIYLFYRIFPFDIGPFRYHLKIFANTHVVRLKLFRLKGSEEHDCAASACAARQSIHLISYRYFGISSMWRIRKTRPRRKRRGKENGKDN